MQHLFGAQSGKCPGGQSWSVAGSCWEVCIKVKVKVKLKRSAIQKFNTLKFGPTRVISTWTNLIIGRKRLWMKLPKPPWPSAGLVRETKRRLARRKPNLLEKNKYYFCPPMSLSSTCGGALCMCWSPQDLGFPNVCPGATFAGLWWAPECGSPKTHPPQQRSSALPHFHTSTDN